MKQLTIVETIGSMSLLATDKTGTLTQNKMTMACLVTPRGCFPIEDIDFCKTEGEVGSSILRFLQLTALFCNQAKVDYGEESDGMADKEETKDGLPVAKQRSAAIVGGNGIDVALMKWILSFPDEMAHLLSAFSVVAAVPFSSATKISAVVISPSNNIPLDSTSQVLVKGAPEHVLDRCAHYLDSDGCEIVLSADILKGIRANIDHLASSGGRVIAMAKASLDSSKLSDAVSANGEPTFPLKDLTFVCCVSVSDPPREGVKEAVEDLRRAGVKIAMVTGDAPNTALAVARQVGLVTLPTVTDGASLLAKKVRAASSNTIAGASLVSCESKGGDEDLEKGEEKVNQRLEEGGQGMEEGEHCGSALVILGPLLEGMGPCEWDSICRHREIVFARVTPDQKLLIVKEFQSRGERVGVTGDGVNDSPALKRADVGIAMNSGSDVAKDAAHVILLEDNFAAIVKAVEEGRLIFANLRKVICYQLSAGSWAELLPVLATFFLGMPQPLSSFLMIVISCLTDVYAGVALTRETSEVSLMTIPPRDLKSQPLVQWSLIAYSYLFYGTLESVASFAAYFLYMSRRGPHVVPDPVPADDQGTRSFPAGYPARELILAWDWGNDKGELGQDNAAASVSASSVFFVVLIVCQWGHLISIRRSSPYFSDSILDTQRRGGTLLSRLTAEMKLSTPKPSIVLVRSPNLGSP